jgi:hypothetical protein
MHLLQKDVAFDFNEKCLVAFRTLESALVSAPITQPPDWSQPFEIMSDAGVKHGYPWVPTDQAHGRPRQVGPAYQKTHRPISGPNRPSWRPTRPPEDLQEDSLDDLIQNDLKTWRTRQDLSGFRQSKSTGYGKMCNVDLVDQESGN